jgi:polysaccharide biosynthesis protein PslG
VGAARRTTILSVVACALALAAPGLVSAAQPGLATDLTWGLSTADQDRTVAAMQDSGAKWTRLSVQWKDYEPSRGSYASWDVAQIDRAVQLCRRAGIRVLLDVVNAPPWASATNDSGQGNVPRNPADFAAFMQHLATRYRGQVDAYEIWNEPDIQRFWNSGPSPTAYTALLKAAYPAVKAGDPSALVVSGGLAWDYESSTSSFLTKMYEAGAKGSFDVLALHDFPDGSISNGLATWAQGRRTARRVMLANGDIRPVWITEYGFNTATAANGWQPSSTPAQQADLLGKALQVLDQDAPWLQVAFYYNFRNNYWQHDKLTDIEAQFGLLNSDFSPKPAYYVFRSYARGSPIAPKSARLVVAGTSPEMHATVTATRWLFMNRFSRSHQVTHGREVARARLGLVRGRATAY